MVRGRNPDGTFADKNGLQRTVKMPSQMRDLCRCQTKRAIKTLSDLMEDIEQPGNVRVTAANTLLDRAWGKAAQSIEVEVTKRTFVDVLRRAAVLEAEDQAAQARLIDGEVLDNDS